MMRSLYSGVTGLKNHQTRMDVIGNNIANVNTVGYKTARVVFQDIYSQTLQGASGPHGANGGANPRQIGLGVTLAAIDVLHTSSASAYTGSALDLAVEGDGYFIIRNGNNANDLAYTRAGNFTISPSGNLVTSNGQLVQCYNAVYQLGINGRTVEQGWTGKATTNTEGFTFNGTLATITETPSGTYTFLVDSTGSLAVEKNGQIMAPQPSFTFTDTLGNVITPMPGMELPYGNYKLTIPEIGEFSFQVTGSSTPYLTDPSTPVAGSHDDTFVLSVTDAAGGVFTLQKDGVTLPSSEYTITGGTYANPGDPFELGEDYTVTVNGLTTPITFTPAGNAFIATGTQTGIVDNYLISVGTTGVVSVIDASTGLPVNPMPIVTLIDNTTGKSVTPGLKTIKPGSYGLQFNGALGLSDMTIDMPGHTFVFNSINDVFKELQNVLNTTSLSVKNNDQFVAGNTLGDVYIDESMYYDVAIDQSGAVKAILKQDGLLPGTNTFAAAGETVTLGYVALAAFINPTGLEKIGSNLYRESANSGHAKRTMALSDGAGKINPGSLEMSNVDLAAEFTDLIITQRGFQANSRTITTSDQILEELVNLKR